MSEYVNYSPDQYLPYQNQEKADSIFSLISKIAHQRINSSAICNEVNNNFSYLYNTDMSRGTIGVLKLHVFNHLNSNSFSNINMLRKFDHLVESEKRAMDPTNPLPTIGIEVECPKTSLKSSSQSILSHLGINNESESGGLWEVNPSFSYNALSQARFLQELAVLGAFPMIERTNGKKSLKPNTSISLHVNLGVPHGISDEYILDSYQDELYLLMNTFTYAYTSPDRIRNRKTSDSLFWHKFAQPSTKNPFSSALRVELRTAEFHDFPSFRMLFDLQDLSAALFSYIKKSQGTAIGNNEAKLASLWKSDYLNEDSFHSTAVKVLYPYLRSTWSNNQVIDNEDKQYPVNLASNEAFKADCLHVISYYGAQVRSILA